jgi:hypothetical protein
MFRTEIKMQAALFTEEETDIIVRALRNFTDPSISIRCKSDDVDVANALADALCGGV